MLPWQPSLEPKSAKLAYSPAFVALAFQNGVEYCNPDFKRFSSDDTATLCENLVNFVLAIPEFNWLKGLHPSSISNLAMIACQCH